MHSLKPIYSIVLFTAKEIKINHQTKIVMKLIKVPKKEKEQVVSAMLYIRPKKN